ncbi:FAD-dependent monooxygenase [Micromonospora yangpuensis]|uniref:2-polyprenyl-6-methoxyphenol hydroxylase n=1 Tax=Micromonospora yangpuensis TaxID=683228 RepID=A0A1C6UFM7_9ACTN|nr:FAD-dependent monooxygenase [Micromonospora yangpuensis]SCL52782.1 2-polyprenyl-6-methoxyphenol hydroxylase [Micromonospora yangpuensis]
MNAGVIVVGAGPVGLMLAGELRLGGVDVVVYDKLPAPSGESRALGFTRRVAEVFEQRGLLSRLGELTQGRQGHFGGVRIDLGRLDESHHGVLGLPQSRTEEMLAGWLAELGVPVRRGYEAVEVRQTGQDVTVVFDGPQGRHEATAGYLVGCDGPQSTVRTATGFETTGWPATRGMYMADITGVELRQRPIGERVPGGNMVLATDLGDGYYRVLIHDRSLRPRPDSEPLTFPEVADAWQRMTGESIHAARARWTCAFSNAARLVTEYRRGRVLLAGDAAHDTPPLAGWGLSVGIQDAVNLGWKLAAVVGGRAPESLLDTYHTERHPLGQQLLRNTHAASTLYLTGDELEPLRGVLRELVEHRDAAGHLAGMVSGLGIRYDLGDGRHPLLGRRMPPDRELVRADGSRTRVAELLHAGRGVFVDTGHAVEPDGSGTTAGAVAGWSDRVDVVTGDWVQDGPGDPAYAALGSVLIRPDGYLAWVAPDGGDLTEALDRWFGAARSALPAEPAAVS